MKTKKNNNRVPLSDIEAAARNIKVDRNGLVRCRVCGCTEIDACPGGCAWVEVDICTTCFRAAEALREWRETSRRANLKGLLREAEFLPERAAKGGAR